ncbi:MAG: hypothetical protein UH241_02725 [Acutalibacteraceae bacterium]|nr:hypothetical protein [Acutalibacteraceae bacterium]
MKILKELFQERYCKDCEYKNTEFYSRNKKDKNKEQLRKFDRLVESLEKISNYNEHILYFNKDATENELLFITIKEKFDFTGRVTYLTFTGHTYRNIYGGERLKPYMCVEAYLDNDNQYLKYFKIVDIRCEPNKGYGSLIMSHFIEYAKSMRVLYISGFLSFVDTADEEHNQRLRHFYSKFGFTIDDKDNIKLQLNK